MKPLLFLDVDGVLGPVSTHPLYSGEAVWHSLPPGHMHFPRTVVDSLIGLAADDVFDIEWLTSWQEDAPDYLAPALGLPPWPVNTKRDAPRGDAASSDWWKEAVVFDRLQQGRRVAWCEDNIQFQANLRVLGFYGSQVHLVCPDSSLGLTSEDFDGLRSWALL